MTVRINISLSEDTLDRLDQYAFEQHKTRSQMITDMVWSAKVKYEQVRGQMNMDTLVPHTGKHTSR